MTVAGLPFYAFAVLTVGGGLGAVALRDAAHSLAALLVALVGAGLLLILAGAVLLGLADLAVWVIAAAGLGMVATRGGAVARRWPSRPRLAALPSTWPLAAIAGAVLITALLAVLATSGAAWQGTGAPAPAGGLLHDPRFLASMLTVLLLAVAGGGAWVVGRVDSDERAHDERARARREREERARRRRDDRVRAREQRAAPPEAGRR